MRCVNLQGTLKDLFAYNQFFLLYLHKKVSYFSKCSFWDSFKW